MFYTQKNLDYSSSAVPEYMAYNGVPTDEAYRQAQARKGTEEEERKKFPQDQSHAYMLTNMSNNGDKNINNKNVIYWQDKKNFNYNSPIQNVSLNTIGNPSYISDPENSVKKLSKNIVENVPSYIPLYGLISQIAHAQNSISDFYDTYKKGGIYAVGEKYAEPSVQKAIAASNWLAKEPISDVDKHQYVSCVGSTDGLLAAGETLAGGIYKEGKDLFYKLNNPQQRAQYGGAMGVVSDGLKDLKNDLIGSWRGFWAHSPQVCEELLPDKLRNRKY